MLLSNFPRKLFSLLLKAKVDQTLQIPQMRADGLCKVQFFFQPPFLSSFLLTSLRCMNPIQLLVRRKTIKEGRLRSGIGIKLNFTFKSTIPLHNRRDYYIFPIVYKTSNVIHLEKPKERLNSSLTDQNQQNHLTSGKL